MASFKQVIVASLPGTADSQYCRELKYIAEYLKELDEKTAGRDHLFIVHDESGRAYLDKHKLVNAKLIQVENYLGMWMRDFPPTMPELQVKFKYKPHYLKAAEAKQTEEDFAKFAEQVKLPTLQLCDIVLDGGNIVENGKDIAIVSDRVFKDNKRMSEDEVAGKLEAAIKRKVIFIPDPEDTTSHSDGVVSFVEESILLVAYYSDRDGKAYYDEIESEIKREAPGVRVAPLPCYEVKKKSYGFDSAEGCYANALVTNNAVYVPFFSKQSNNERAFEVYKSHTQKEVVPILSAGNLAILGGSVRCLSWQVSSDHPVSQSLFRYVDENEAHGSSCK